MPPSTKIVNQNQYHILGNVAEMQLLLQIRFFGGSITSYKYLVCRYLSVNFFSYIYFRSNLVSPEKDNDIPSQS